MSKFHVDPWEAARQYHERRMREFMARLLQHFNVDQVTLDMSKALYAGDAIEWQTLPNGDIHYRIIGKLELEKSDISGRRS